MSTYTENQTEDVVFKFETTDERIQSDFSPHLSMEVSGNVLKKLLEMAGDGSVLLQLELNSTDELTLAVDLTWCQVSISKPKPPKKISLDSVISLVDLAAFLNRLSSRKLTAINEASFSNS